MSEKVLLVSTSADVFTDSGTATGLWLSELTHAWDVFDAAGFDQTIASVKGGRVPVDPRSLEGSTFDETVETWTTDPAKKALLENTVCLADVDVEDYDAIYLAGGHGAMYDFPTCGPLENAVLGMWEKSGVVAAVCHGYCGLVDVKDADGSWFVAGKKLTGFSWTEEVAAGVSKIVPYDVEKLAKEHGAKYKKALIPFTDYVVVDGALVTGENPQSARDTARRVTGLLQARR